MEQDVLKQIMNERSKRTDVSYDSQEDFIYHVVGDYIYYLYQRGFIPNMYEDELEKDLREEVLSLLQNSETSHLTFES